MNLEETTQTTQKSRLQSILEKNASGEGVTTEEYNEVRELISKPKYSEKDCSFCISTKKKAIYDTGLCQDHAFYALIRRK